MNKLPLAGLLAALACAGLVGCQNGTSTPPAAEQISTASALPSITSAAERVPPAAIERHEAEVQRGDSLQAALSRLPLGETAPVVRAAAEVIDLRRLPIGAGLVFQRDPAQGLESVAIRAERERFLRLTRDVVGDGAWEAEWVELARQTDVETAGGTITSSVSSALEGAVLAGPLTMAFADVVQWDVDLLVDPRGGDGVRIVYEVDRLADAPGDLPTFRDAPTEPGAVLGLGKILAARYDGSIASAEAYWVELPDGSGSFFDTHGRPLRKTFLKSPLNYRRVSSGFSRARRHPISGKVRAHKGVDLAAPHGTAIVATADGIVEATGWMGGLGRAIKIRHGSEYMTVYGHLSRVESGLRRGARVRQNDVIGRVGSTGAATGPHLHYELHISGRAINPLRFESPVAEPLDPALLPDLLGAVSRWDPVLARIDTGTPDVQLADSKRRSGSVGS